MNNLPVTLRVEAKVLGKRRPAASPWQVSLDSLLHASSFAESALHLRDLLAYIVREEVRTFRQRQQERRLLTVLSPQQIDEAARQGRIALGGAEQPLPEVDEERAVQVALQGFVDGLYLVFLDGQQYKDLESVVQPRPDSTLLFLRLVALVGG